MKSPDGRYEVQKSDFNEIRMGSPLFGEIELRGVDLDMEGLFGEPMEFSPDSRYLAVECLVDAKNGPHIHAVVIDLTLQRQLVVHDQNPGLVRRFVWATDRTLIITIWSHFTGEKEIVWRPPSSDDSTVE